MMTFKASVITVSDRAYRKEYEDLSGPNLVSILKEKGYEVVFTTIVPDEYDQIKKAILTCIDELNIHLVITSGGTGFSKRDITPEVTKDVIEREVPGIPEVMRMESMKITDRACLSRSVCGIRKNSLILNLPGSKKGSEENLLSVIDPIAHGLLMLQSNGSAE